MKEHQIILQGTTDQQLVEKIAIRILAALEENQKVSTTKQEDTLLTRDEVCDLLSINKSTLWKRTKAGKLQSYGSGRRVYYKRSEVLESLTPLKQ